MSTIGRRQPTDGPVYAVGCIGVEKPSFLRLKVNISEEGELLLLIDTGADISLLKGANLIGSTEYDPEGKVRVKSVNRSWI
jgi:hypothetical protein